MVPSGIDLRFICPPRMPINLYSNNGTFVVAAGASLTFVGCDVQTVASRSDAATGPLAPSHMDAYLGDNRGATLRFKNSRLLVPSEVCYSRTQSLLLVVFC